MAVLSNKVNIGNLAKDEFEDTDFKPLAEGMYDVQVDKVEVKELPNDNGDMLVMAFKVISNESTGRLIWDRLCIEHSSDTAKNIAQAKLGHLMRSLNVEDLEDTDQLVGAKVSAKVTIREAEGEYKASNEMKWYKKFAGTSVASAAPSGSGESKPW